MESNQAQTERPDPNQARTELPDPADVRTEHGAPADADSALPPATEARNGLPPAAEARAGLPEPTEARIQAGAESYRRPMLAAYDLFVLGMMSRFMWRCPRGRMLKHYNRQISAVHLDIGPGTGWFLDKCRFPAESPSITLLDLNEVVLATASHRIRRYRPEARVGDAFKPFALGAERFDSVGMNFLLHCLPGAMAQKAVVFDHVTPFLRPGARVFGSTVLGEGPHHTQRSGKLLAKLNRSEVFSNLGDRLEDLDEQLRARFTDVETVRAGAVCLFSARYPGER